jgi:hypothetical protein
LFALADNVGGAVLASPRGNGVPRFSLTLRELDSLAIRRLPRFGMSARIASAPMPDDPLWFRRGENLKVWCRCGHSAVLRLDRLAREYGIDPHTPLNRIANRLRCRFCGREPVQTGVARRD